MEWDIQGNPNCHGDGTIVCGGRRLLGEEAKELKRGNTEGESEKEGEELNPHQKYKSDKSTKGNYLASSLEVLFCSGHLLLRLVQNHW